MGAWRELRRRWGVFGSLRAAWKLRKVERALFLDIARKRRGNETKTLYYCDAHEILKAAAWNEREAHRLEGRKTPARKIRPAREKRRIANLEAAQCLRTVAGFCGEGRVCDQGLVAQYAIGCAISKFREDHGLPTDA